MKNRFSAAIVAACAAFSLIACNKQVDSTTPRQELSADEANLITAAGLKSSGAVKTDGGYLIEGDILLTADALRAMSNNNGPELVVASTEQYRTTNLVTNLPRTITVRYTGTRTSLSTALNNAISRYNALGLTLTFQRVAAGSAASITLSDVSGANYIASAGFPTSAGNPHNAIQFNTAYAGWNANTLTSVVAHEIGHCIGFRHTDYMNRAYSCGGSFFNEGSGGVGAVHIPGTPTTADPNSWMLACIGNGINRPFNANDQIALNFLY